jgi:hypothetical protein
VRAAWGLAASRQPNSSPSRSFGLHLHSQGHRPSVDRAVSCLLCWSGIPNFLPLRAVQEGKNSERGCPPAQPHAKPAQGTWALPGWLSRNLFLRCPLCLSILLREGRWQRREQAENTKQEVELACIPLCLLSTWPQVHTSAQGGKERPASQAGVDTKVRQLIQHSPVAGGHVQIQGGDDFSRGENSLPTAPGI